MPAPTRLAVFENQVYWSDSTKQGIMSVNKYGGPSSIQTVFKNRDVKDPKAVKIVHSLLQKPGKFIDQYKFSRLYDGISLDQPVCRFQSMRETQWLLSTLMYCYQSGRI